MRLAAIKKDGKYLWRNPDTTKFEWTEEIALAFLYVYEDDYRFLKDDIHRYGGKCVEIEIREVIPHKGCPSCYTVIDSDEEPLQDKKFYNGVYYMHCPHCGEHLKITEYDMHHSSGIETKYVIERDVT
jgi:hypothetical protein